MRRLMARIREGLARHREARRLLKAQWAARIRQRARNLLDVPDSPHVVEHFTEHGEVIEGLRRDLDAGQQLLREAVRQLNQTTLATSNLARRLAYYETHSAIIERLRREFNKAEKARENAKPNGAPPIEVVG